MSKKKVKDTLTTNVQPKLFSLPDAKPMLSVRASRSSGKWEAIKNSSWSERYVSEFGNRAGYVICHHNRNRELVALATVIGMPFVQQTEIDANAKLIEAAPALLDALEKFTLLDENHYREIAGLIQYAKNVVERLS
jgi:hypothetical protein